MRCEKCKGEGYLVPLWAASSGYNFFDGSKSGRACRHEQPCPDCNGTGITSCCEGSERHGQLPDNPES